MAKTTMKEFQRLWNRNHPEDPIAEDGIYGPMTEARLRAAPATGFPNLDRAECSVANTNKETK